MKIIIVGAGDVGTVSAQTLADIHDVMIVENDKVVSDSIRDRLNVSVYNEDGTNPSVIGTAINSHQAELILACTGNDAWNLFICMIAKRHKPEIRTVASITDPDYIIKLTDDGYIGVDGIITPELIAAKKMFKLATLENAVDYESVESLNSCIGIFLIQNFHPIVGQIIMHLNLPEKCTVFGIYRDDKLYTGVDTMQIRAGDRIALFGSDDAITEFNRLIDPSVTPNSDIAILGGSIAGVQLAMLLADYGGFHVKLVEKDPELSRIIEDRLSNVFVINADFNDPEIHQSENLYKADCTLCASRKDETNLLVSMSGKKYMARKVVVRYFKKEYEDVFEYTGLDSIISYPSIITNEITKAFIRDETAVIRMRDPTQLFFSHTVTSDSPLSNQFIGDLSFPEGVKIVTIIRGNSMAYPELDTRISINDNIIFFTNLRDSSKLVPLLGRDRLPGL